MNDTIYVLDGYGLVYRAYFAFMSKPLTDEHGNNVSAIFGFFHLLFSLHRKYKARKILVAFDPPGPTFRHQRYPEYKATRDKAPEDLHAQIAPIKEMLGYLGIASTVMEGFEADDIMGSVAQYCRKKGIDCCIISADKDLMQLVGDGTTMLRPDKGSFQLLDSDGVMETKGVRPNQIVDYLALMGDSSDNIPGVSGVGEKTAVKLLVEWDNLDNIYANIDAAAKGKLKEKLVADRENARLSRELVSIRCDLDIAESLSEIESLKPDIEAAKAFLKERNMRSLLDGLKNFYVEEEISAAGHTVPEASAKTFSKSPINAHYTPVLTSGQLSLWKSKIQQAGLVALDTETDDKDPMRASLVGISFSVDPGEAAYLPVRRPDGSCIPLEEIVSWLNETLGDGIVKIIGQNFKYDLKVLRRHGVTVGAAWFDTMIAAWILDASAPLGMDALAGRYLNAETIKFSDVVPKGQTFADVPLTQALQYAAEDAAITLRLYNVLAPLLKADARRWKIFKDYEIPLQEILADMELEGIGLDVGELNAYSMEMDSEIDRLTKEIYALHGREFNIASPLQLQTVLFEERGLTPIKKTKTGYSTDFSVLSILAAADPIAEKILQYRTLSKLKSTYVDVLPLLIHPLDGRIHTSYSQTGAATGRLSSNNPNLQNIPIRDESGRRIRRAFKSRPGHRFISADYSQIELVILAHLSGDEALCKAFRDGVDVHSQTAMLLFGIEASEVEASQRRMAKAVNFGVMYGMSAFRLANEMKISRKEAQHFIETYFGTYHGIKQFIKYTVESAEKDGGVRTMEGRFRPLPNISSRNRVEKAAAERAAVNSRIQGTAADIMKLAMIHVYQVLKAHYPDAMMLLQVHDEMLIEVPENKVDDVAKLVKKTMEAAVHLSVPLHAEVESGGSWGDIH